MVTARVSLSGTGLTRRVATFGKRFPTCSSVEACLRQIPDISPVFEGYRPAVTEGGMTDFPDRRVTA